MAILRFIGFCVLAVPVNITHERGGNRNQRELLAELFVDKSLIHVGCGASRRCLRGCWHHLLLRKAERQKTAAHQE